MSRIAPVPGGIQLVEGTALHNPYLLPVGITQTTNTPYRVKDLGKRVHDDEAAFKLIALAGEGGVAGVGTYAEKFQSKPSAFAQGLLTDPLPARWPTPRAGAASTPRSRRSFEREPSCIADSHFLLHCGLR